MNTLPDEILGSIGGYLADKRACESLCYTIRVFISKARTQVSY
jgi:hypothetical protein